MAVDKVQNFYGEKVRIAGPIDEIAYASNVHPAGMEELAKQGYTVREMPQDLRGQELSDRLNDADALVCRTSYDLREEILRNSQLQLLFNACKNGRVDPKDLTKLGIMGLKTDVNAPAVAEFVLNMLSDYFANFSGGDRAMRQAESGQYPKSAEGNKRLTLRGKTFGIIGFGNVGQEVAKLMTAIGMKVIAYNSRTKNRRLRDEKMTYKAGQMGVELVDSKEELLDKAHILSLHTGPFKHTGESNNGIITTEDLIRFGSRSRDWKNSEKLINENPISLILNADRAEFFPSLEEIQKLIDQGILGAYFADVLPKSMEGREYQGFPIDQNYHKIRLSPHIAGSGPEILEKTSLHIAQRLPEWDTRGNLRDDGISFRRVELRTAQNPGDLAFLVLRSTRSGILSDIHRVLNNLDFNIEGDQHLPDRIEGTRIKREFVPHKFVLDLNGNGGIDSYRTYVENLVEGLLKIQGLKLIKIMPTNNEQEKELRKRSLSPNLITV